MTELSSRDVLSAHGADAVHDHMVAFIRRNFSDTLGSDVDLLSLPEGLRLIQERVWLRLMGGRTRLLRALARLRSEPT
ncbi:MAG: hypothetical protein L0216_14095 [Planctomycetales bacterium]|nr:hypothetical protein [Planctomycetales bacterium]